MTPLPTCDYLFLPVKNYETTTFEINMKQNQVLIKAPALKYRISKTLAAHLFHKWQNLT